MKKILRVIAVDYKKLSKEDWDSVLIIAGDEGTGKSQLGLHIVDEWMKLSGRECTEQDIKYICLNIEQFVGQLKQLEKVTPIVYDEAGELSNLRRTSQFNVAINLAYQIIRGKNILTILILPSLFDLDAFFTKRRARGFIQVWTRGKYAFYNKRKLREIMEVYQRKKNQYIALKKVKPLFKGTFKIYTGVMAKAYKEKKETRMNEVIKILEEKLGKLNKGEDKNDMENNTEEHINMGIPDNLIDLSSGRYGGNNGNTNIYNA